MSTSGDHALELSDRAVSPHVTQERPLQLLQDHDASRRCEPFLQSRGLVGTHHPSQEVAHLEFGREPIAELSPNDLQPSQRALRSTVEQARLSTSPLTHDEDGHRPTGFP